MDLTFYARNQLLMANASPKVLTRYWQLKKQSADLQPVFPCRWYKFFEKYGPTKPFSRVLKLLLGGCLDLP
jgi:hypothetical protein